MRGAGGKRQCDHVGNALGTLRALGTARSLRSCGTGVSLRVCGANGTGIPLRACGTRGAGRCLGPGRTDLALLTLGAGWTRLTQGVASRGLQVDEFQTGVFDVDRGDRSVLDLPESNETGGGSPADATDRRDDKSATQDTHRLCPDNTPHGSPELGQAPTLRSPTLKRRSPQTIDAESQRFLTRLPRHPGRIVRDDATDAPAAMIPLVLVHLP